MHASVYIYICMCGCGCFFFGQSIVHRCCVNVKNAVKNISYGEERYRKSICLWHSEAHNSLLFTFVKKKITWNKTSFMHNTHLQHCQKHCLNIQHTKFGISENCIYQKHWHREVRPNYRNNYTGQRANSRPPGRGRQRRVDPALLWVSLWGVRLPWPTKWQALYWE